MNEEIQRLIESEVERQVENRLNEEMDRMSDEETIERFVGIYHRMNNKERAQLLIDLISPGDESLCDSFGEGTWGMSKEYKSRVAMLMILENMRDA